MKRDLLRYAALTKSATTICRLMGGLEISGKENVPASGPFILVANHLSDLDPPTLAGCCPRHAFFMAKEELFHVPIVGPYLASIGSFPVRRGAADRAALRHALRVLEAGKALGMFPEGHRSEDGRLQPAENGVGLIALHSRAPILPAGITGTEKILPPHSKRLHFGKVRVRFGPVLTLDDLYEQHGREANNEATRRIMAAIAALLPPEYQSPEKV